MRGVCSLEHCDRPHSAKGLCRMHYKRLLRGADLMEPPQHLRQPKFCSVDGCERKAMARTWCQLHYTRWKRTGDPLAVIEPARWKRRNLMRTGYVRVWCPEHPAASADGYALEHRKVWWDAHGPIPEGYEYHVHHKNGVKSDNRLENLELLTVKDHHRQHMAMAGRVTNQYGTWPLRVPA